MPKLSKFDPLHIGDNQKIPQPLAAVSPAETRLHFRGGDAGLNFSGLRFNAPDHRDDRAYVAKMDFILDKAARHTLSVRGTLSNATRDRDTLLQNSLPRRRAPPACHNFRDKVELPRF